MINTKSLVVFAFAALAGCGGKEMIETPSAAKGIVPKYCTCQVLGTVTAKYYPASGWSFNDCANIIVKAFGVCLKDNKNQDCIPYLDACSFKK